MGFPTPNSVPLTTTCRTIQIPDDPLWFAIVNGALSELMDIRNYEPYGTLTPEETANAYADMFQEYLASSCTPSVILPDDLQDDFKRGDFATLGNNWSVDYLNYGFPALALVDGKAQATSTYQGDWWNLETYGPNSHVFAQIGALVDGQGVFINFGLLNPHTNNASGYGVQISRASGVYTIIVQSTTNRTPSTLTTFTPVTFADNYWLRASKVGTTITVYTSPDGVTWTTIGTVTSSAYSTGYLGLFTTNASGGDPITIGAFGGGTLP